MNAKWKIVMAVLGVVVMGFGVQSAVAGGIPTVPVGGGGGGSGNGLPGNWNMSSGSSRSDETSSAWANMSGPTMGIPDSVSANINWYYIQNSKPGEGAVSDDDGDLYFTIDFYGSGDVETPTAETNLGAGGRLVTNSVMTQPFTGPDGEGWWVINYEEQLTIDWNGNYSSSVYDDGNGGIKSNGSFNANVWASAFVNLSADPQLSFNRWDDPKNPEPEWFNDYDATVRVFGRIPEGAYTATIVPEPMTVSLLGVGAVALLRRPRRERLEHNKTQQNRLVSDRKVG